MMPRTKIWHHLSQEEPLKMQIQKCDDDDVVEEAVIAHKFKFLPKTFNIL